MVTQPEEDILFLACTRPAMFAGVTVQAFGLNLVLTSFIYLCAGSIFYSVVGIFIHFGLAGILRDDPNRLRVLWQYAGTKGGARNTGIWGGSTKTPLQLYRKYAIGDML